MCLFSLISSIPFLCAFDLLGFGSCLDSLLVCGGKGEKSGGEEGLILCIRVWRRQARLEVNFFCVLVLVLQLGRLGDTKSV